VAAEPGWRWAWSSTTRAKCRGNDNDTVVLIVTGAVKFGAYPVDGRVHSRRGKYVRCLNASCASAVLGGTLELMLYRRHAQGHLGSLRVLGSQTVSQEVAESKDLRHNHAQAHHCSFHDDFAAVRAAKRDIRSFVRHQRLVAAKLGGLRLTMTSFARHPAPAPNSEWLVVNIACLFTCICGLQHFIHA